MADYVYGPGRNHLFVPGPVNIPDPVIRAMNRQNEDYRSPALPVLTKNLLEDVKKIFKTTTGTTFIIPTTGTGRNLLHLPLTACVFMAMPLLCTWQLDSSL
jgi:alanine-glyoxylate transaminase/serine-glyoxylate transaminase/serine-pyruvate transaminase